MASKRDREKTVRQEEAAAPVPAWHGKAYGALIAAGGLMLLLSLATFRLNEVGWTALNAKAEVVASNTNFFGFFGRYLAALSYWCFGAASWMAAACLVWLGCYKIVHHGEIRLRMWIAFGCAVLSACMMLSVQPWVLSTWAAEHQVYGPGGALGHLFGHCFISQVMGMGGSLILCVLAYLVSLVYVLGTTPLAAGRVLWHDFRQWLKAACERRRARKEAKAVLMREREEENARRALETGDLQSATEPLSTPSRKAAVSRRTRQSGDPLDDLEKKVEEEIVAMTEPGFLPLSVKNPEPQIIDASRTRPPRPVLTLRSDDGAAADAAMDAYALPSLEILHYEESAGEQTEDDRALLLENQQIIVETLLSFGVEVAAGNITKGPTITRYEIYPSKGLRVNRITSLEKDIARATKAERINILAPIPGRDTIGIEIANSKKIAVALRELLQDDEFLSPKKRIPVALGKDVYGRTVIGDLAAMPHLLVAGATGSGKSVCINSMITSMLYKFKPDELRLILVDPKVVEMQPYRKLPHLIVPVVTDPKKVIGALRWAVNEMERRYRMFAEVGVRNFESFNARPKDEPVEEEESEEPEEPDFELADRIARELESQDDDTMPEDEDDGQDELDLDAGEELPEKIPYIVIIIDELADLMMVVKEDLENYIARLTQKARAAGIHLIVATQTPRSDVVTGMIKANIPSRIAFQVSSALDSRIILDSSGAEKLVGKGDLLYLPPGSAKLERAQGAFVSDEEVEKIVKHCATQAKQSFHEEVQQSMESDGGDGSSGGDSIDAQDAELLQRCIEIVIVERKASTSLLQRRLRIGYGKAARMLELMEQRGIVAPSDGANRPREVLVD